MKLNEKIRELRKEKKLTQEQLAEAMEVSTASVSKWETGQAVPEVTMLVALADYFQVSVDAMLGHEVSGDHMEAMLSEMERLSNEKRMEEAKTLAEKLVRGYPNTYKVIEAASNTYSTAHLVGQNRADMERAIELTNRLFALSEDPTGAKRFELLSRLANHYEMLEDWDMARKYYKEGNVGTMNDRNLACCLANAGKKREALGEISDVFSLGVMELASDAIMLEQVWQKLGQPEKAEAAIQWVCRILGASGGTLARKYAIVRATMYAELAMLKEEMGKTSEADDCVRLAMEVVRGGLVDDETPDFLEPSKIHVMIGGKQSHEAMIQAMLSKPEHARLLVIAQHACNTNA